MLKQMKVMFGLLALLAAAVAGQASPEYDGLTPPAAVGDPTGVLSGTIDGEEFILHSFLVESGLPEPTNTAYFEDWRSIGAGISVDIMTQREPAIGTTAMRGAVVLDLALTSDLTLSNDGDVPDITYFESITNGYRMTEGTLELTEVSWVDEATLALSGSFAGVFTNAMTQETTHIAAMFSIGWISQVTNAF